MKQKGGWYLANHELPFIMGRGESLPPGASGFTTHRIGLRWCNPPNYQNGTLLGCTILVHRHHSKYHARPQHYSSCNFFFKSSAWFWMFTHRAGVISSTGSAISKFLAADLI